MANLSTQRMKLYTPQYTGYSYGPEKGARYGYGPEAQWYNQRVTDGPFFELSPSSPTEPLKLPGEAQNANAQKNQNIATGGALGGLAGGLLLPKAVNWATGGSNATGKGDLLSSLSGSGALQSSALAGAGTGAGSFLGKVLGGADPEDAIAGSAGAGLGSFAGGALGSFLGPIGTVAGTAVGGFLGEKVGEKVDDFLFDRVICSQLWKMNKLLKKEVIVDLRFTKERLTDAHIRGYHFWARRVVKALKEGRWVNTWQFIARHRSAELSYQLGMSACPDYPGKLIRWVFEPACYIIGITLAKKEKIHARTAHA